MSIDRRKLTYGRLRSPSAWRDLSRVESRQGAGRKARENQTSCRKMFTTSLSAGKASRGFHLPSMRSVMECESPAAYWITGLERECFYSESYTSISTEHTHLPISWKQDDYGAIYNKHYTMWVTCKTLMLGLCVCVCPSLRNHQNMTSSLTCRIQFKDSPPSRCFARRGGKSELTCRLGFISSRGEHARTHKKFPFLDWIPHHDDGMKCKLCYQKGFWLFVQVLNYKFLLFLHFISTSSSDSSSEVKWVIGHFWRTCAIYRLPAYCEQYMLYSWDTHTRMYIIYQEDLSLHPFSAAHSALFQKKARAKLATS